MKRPGFSLSTIVLVVLLLGAVAWVGSLVSPVKPAEGDGHDHEQEQAQKPAETPPGKPGELPKPNTGIASSSSEERKKQQENELKERKRTMQYISNNIPGSDKAPNKKLPMKDPEAIDPTAQHFFQEDMGASGITKQQEEIARLKKIYKAQNNKPPVSGLGKTMAVEPGDAESTKSPAPK